MLFRIHLLLAVILHVSSMKMRETVERMVMVRTSGSDLQPEATGYIYKKKDDGEESVIEMGQSEVMEHLAKYYKQPKSYKEPSHVDGDAQDGEKNKIAPKEDGRVIPVSEESDEKVDGLASDDFKKYLEKYGVKFDEHDNYDHYSSGPGDFVGDYYHGYGDDSKENKNKNNHHYGAGDYHNGKYEGYTYSHKEGDEEDKKDNDPHKEHDELKPDKQKESQDGNNKKGYARFQKTYDNEQKDRKYYDHDDGEKFAFYKYGGGTKYGDDHGYRHESHEAGDNDTNNGKASEESGAHGTKDSAKEQADSSDEKPQHYGSEGSQTYGKSFSFKVKHY